MTRPGDVTMALIAAKAEHVMGRLDQAVAADCVVVGCDSMLYRGDELRCKPASEKKAKHRWRTIAGRTCHLHTGHCVIRLIDNVIADGDPSNEVGIRLPLTRWLF
jgi:septum formation protein